MISDTTSTFISNLNYTWVGHYDCFKHTISSITMCSEPTWSVAEDVHGANGVENGRLYIFLFAWFLRGLIGAVKVLMKRSRDTRLFTSFMNTFWLKFSTALSLASHSNLAFHQFFFLSTIDLVFLILQLNSAFRFRDVKQHCLFQGMSFFFAISEGILLIEIILVGEVLHTELRHQLWRDVPLFLL